MKIWIWKLSPEDVARGRSEGADRTAESSVRKYKVGSRGIKNYDEREAGDIRAAWGEIGFGRILGVEVDLGLVDLRTHKKPHDVAGYYEIHSTAYADGQLRHEKGKDDETKPFILNVSREPYMEYKGWRWGWECRQEKYWKALDPNRPPSWFIPQRDLSPMETLPGTDGNPKDWSEVEKKIRRYDADLWMKLWNMGVNQPGKALDAGILPPDEEKIRDWIAKQKRSW